MPNKSFATKNLEALLTHPTFRELARNVRRGADRVARQPIVGRMRTLLDDLAKDMTRRAQEQAPRARDFATRMARRMFALDAGQPRSTINATSVLFPSDLTTPLAPSVLDAVAGVYIDYASTGKHAQQGSAGEAASLIASLVGAEAASVHASTLAALLAALRSLEGTAVVLARSEVAPIDGVLITDLIEQCGLAVREVGPASGARASDYQSGVDDDTAAIIRFATANSEATCSRAELVEFARNQRLAVIEILTLPTLLDLSDQALPAAQKPADALTVGVDAVVFAGDKLIGGPACGILAGRESLAANEARDAMTFATAADPYTQALLAETLRLYRDEAKVRQELPAWQLWDTSIENLKLRAERLAELIRTSPRVANVETVELETQLSLDNGAKIASFGLRLTPRDNELFEALTAGSPSLRCELSGSDLILNLRGVFARQDELIAPLFAVKPAESEG